MCVRARMHAGARVFVRRAAAADNVAQRGEGKREGEKNDNKNRLMVKRQKMIQNRRLTH